MRDGADPDNPQSAIRNPQLRGAVAVRVGVDVGGTFTDLVALADNGEIAVRKVVTTPHDPAVGMFRAIELLSAPVDILVHGTRGRSPQHQHADRRYTYLGNRDALAVGTEERCVHRLATPVRRTLGTAPLW